MIDHQLTNRLRDGLVDILADRLSSREFSELRDPRGTANEMARELAAATYAGDIGGMISTIEKVHRIAARIEEPESAADRRPIRIEDSEDWATTRVARQRRKP